MVKKFLLGVTKDYEIAFANVEFDSVSGKFRASFDTVTPVKWDYDTLYDFANDWLCFASKEMCYDLCEIYVCSPQTLIDRLLDDDCEMENIVDVSLFDAIYEANGDEYKFQSIGCGQLDLRNEMKIYTNESLFNKIISLWEKYHLKDITDFEEIILLFNEEHEEETEEFWEDWIVNYLTN